ncbi:hypothetical protein [Azotobacter salinestris]|uniref:hypothetical protein n=1 Tax=Azotobacter salinestris TaxID=69964 RepID=UPI0032DE4696
MRNLLVSLAVIAAITSSSSFAADLAYTRNVSHLKSGQCVFAGYTYEQGELLKMKSGVTKVCTTIQGRDVWLTVDQKALDELTY